MIKYFDIFAGIGGFRSGLEKAGGFECVGYCEIDKYAKKAYETLYDIVTLDGTTRAYAGDVVSEITTDENGYAETEPLYLGKYEIREIKAPDGYVLNNEPKDVELTYAGQEFEVRDTVNTAFENEYQGVEDLAF